MFEAFIRYQQRLGDAKSRREEIIFQDHKNRYKNHINIFEQVEYISQYRMATNLIISVINSMIHASDDLVFQAVMIEFVIELRRARSKFLRTENEYL